MPDTTWKIHFGHDTKKHTIYEFIPPSVGGIEWLRPLLFKGGGESPRVLKRGSG